MNTDKTVVKIMDVYHCTGCNARLGYATVYSDGTEDFTCDCHVTCFGFLLGLPSYQKERVMEECGDTSMG